MLTQNPSARMLAHVGDPFAELRDQLADPDVVGRVDVRQGADVVALPSTPRNVAEVQAVVDPVVDERHQILLVDGVPHPQLSGDPTVEVAEDVEPVGALGGGGQAEQLDRLNVFEQGSVRRRGGVVELVDDDDVEVLRVERTRSRSQ